MTKYNFDQVVDREHSCSAKYDERVKHFGTDQVIPMWIADMDFPTAPAVIDAMVRRAQEGICGYAARPASYFQAVCGWQLRRNGWHVDPACCSYALGVIPAIGSMIQYMTQPGDRILIQSPVYGDFFDIIHDNQREIVENRMIPNGDGTWSVDWADFEEKIRTVKMFLLCSPHNPLGIVWQRHELEKMVSLARENGVILISDEIHSDLIFNGKRHIPAASLSPEAAAYVITCISASKTFNLAGLQASTTVFPTVEMKNQFDRFWRNLEIHRNNTFSLVAVEAAYREGEDWLEELKVYIRENFQFVHDYCKQNIPGVSARIPDATYLMWLDCRGLGMHQEELVKFMIEKAGLGLSSGTGFAPSLEGYMRLNAACPRSTLERAMTQLAAAVRAL